MPLPLIRNVQATGQKTQLVRLLDVFVFGPLMIAAAIEQEKPYFKAALTLIGIGTIVYNGVNYLSTAQKLRDEQSAAGALEGRPAAPLPRRVYHPSRIVH